MTININFVYKHDEHLVLLKNLKVVELNSSDSNKNHYYICAANGCNNDGIHFLSASCIHKIGLFCDSCREEFEECGFVDTISFKSIK
jgi:hypothetical protein